MEFVDIKERLPQEGERVLTWDGYSYKVEELYWFEGENDDIPVFMSELGSNRDVILWMQLPYQPERSKREDLERGCGALNSMET